MGILVCPELSPQISPWFDPVVVLCEVNILLLNKGDGSTEVCKRSCGNTDQELNSHLLSFSVLATELT